MEGLTQKPTAQDIKALLGNPDAPKPSAPQLNNTVPDMPFWLDDDAQSYWPALVEALQDLNVLQKCDGLVLSILCNNLARMVDCMLVMKEENSRVYETEGRKGRMARVHPLQKIVDGCENKILGICSTMGMTPTARAKLKTADTGQGDLFPEDDPSTQFMN